MSRLVIVIGSAMLLPSCKGVDPAYCRTHPEDIDCRGDAGIGMSCMNDTYCMKMTPVCDMKRLMCVECSAAESQACRDATPVCGDSDACRGCAADAECASLTCLPDGSCAVVGSVLYAAPDGASTANCTAAAACTLARAVELVDGTRSTIRLAEGHYSLGDTLALTVSMRIVGRGAAIDRDAGGTGATLTIGDGTIVALDYLTVEGGDGDAIGFGIDCAAASLTGVEIAVLGNAAAGINSIGCSVVIDGSQIAMNQGPGISLSSGSATVTRSVIAANQSGGVIIAGAVFDLHNDFIVKNGNPNSAIGGVLISQITTRDTHRFDFNTVAQNQATVGSTPGVVCSVVATPLAFTSDIVFGNADGTQVEGGNCTWTYSDIGPESVGGTGNLASDPEFVAPAQNNFHLQVSSPLRDAADPAATLADDIDGDVRPQGSGRDVGADEIK